MIAPKNKTNKRVPQRSGNRQASRKQPVLQKRNSAPSTLKSVLSSLLKSGGAMVGGALGGPAGATLGGAAGSLISRITGMGDYKVAENTIVSGTVPQFTNGGRTVRVSHRDFLGDVSGSIAFSVRNYALNPGVSSTFPWLSSLAANFQTYKIRGMVFEFKSTSAVALNNINSALGTVIMATQYNSMLSNFTSKIEMENYEFSSSCKPAESMYHPVECAQGESPLECLYIRNGAVPASQDARFFDFGEFQIATVGMQAASTIGELWVTYDIELLKPRILPGGTIPGQFTRINNGPWTATAFLGSLQTTPKGNLGITVSAVGVGFDTLNFPSSISAGKFMVVVSWVGTVAVNVVIPTRTLTNCTLVADWRLSSSTSLDCPTGGTSNAFTCDVVLEVTINGYSALGSLITFSAGTLPTTQTFVDIFVVSIPVSDSYV